MVIEENDVELDSFLNAGMDFLSHHQIGAIADHHIDLAVRRGHLYSEPSGDFISHAGVAILHVITLRIPGPPQLVEISRQAACGANQDVARLGNGVDDADDFALAYGRSMMEVKEAVDLFFPFLAKTADAFLVAFGDAIAFGRL